jgi:monoamine oxidase
MNRQHQTDFRPGHGNALQACVASIFEKPITSVPNFINDVNGYYQAIQKYAMSKHQFQFQKVNFNSDGLLPFAILPGSRVILRGTSPRGDFGHVVVAKVSEDGRSVENDFDPHPSGEFLIHPLVWCGFFISPKEHVIVIGGGACGLACIREIRRLRPHTCITLIEGRNRLGGRCCTVNLDDVQDKSYDSGAAWVHGTDLESPLVQLAKEFNVGMHPVVDFNPWLHPYALPKGKLALYYQGLRVDDKQSSSVSKGWDMYEKLLHTVSNFDASNSTSTLKERVDKELQIMMDGETDEIVSLVIRFGLSMMECWHGGNLNDLSAEEFEGVYNSGSSSGGGGGSCSEWPLMGDYRGSHCSVEGGVGNLMKRFGEKVINEGNGYPVRVLLNSVVSSIVTQDDGGEQQQQNQQQHNDESKLKATQNGIPIPTKISRTTVILENGTNIPPSECIVCTVPLGVLKSNIIKFVPSLSLHLIESMENIKMCNYVKIIMTFKNIFWPRDALFLGSLSSDRSKKTVIFDVVANVKENKALSNVICGTITGTDQIIDNALDIALNALKEMFFPNVKDEEKEPNESKLPDGMELESTPVVTSWLNDSMSMGAYSYGNYMFQEEDMLQLSTPDVKNGRYIILAGEHTSMEYNGSVHAALHEGKRAAIDVLNVM